MGTARKISRTVAGAALLVVFVVPWAAHTEELGVQCFDRTDPDKAIMACTAIINKWTMTTHDAASVHVARGQAREDKGEYPGAFTDFRQAMTYFRWYGSAYHARARLYLRTGKAEYALRDAETEIKYDPKDATAFDLRALAKAALGRAAEAQADAATATALAGDDAHINNERCWVRAVLNRDLATALAACNVALAKTTNEDGLYDSRGFVHFRAGNLPQARADFDAALALKPQSAASLFMRGIVKRRTGDSGGGDSDIVAAMSVNPNVENEYAHYGVTR